MRLAPWNQFKPSSKIFLLTVPKRYFFCGSFVGHLCYLCIVFFMVSRLFIAAFWSPAGRGFLFVMFNCVFVTFPCGILGQVWCLIVSMSDLCRHSYFFVFFVFFFFFFFWGGGGVFSCADS